MVYDSLLLGCRQIFTISATTIAFLFGDTIHQLLGSRCVGDTLGDPDFYAVCRAAEQIPQERGVGAGNRGRDIRGCVAHANGEDLDVGRGGEEGRREGQDTLAIGGAHLREDGHDAVGILLHQSTERGESGPGGRPESGRGQGEGEGAEQRDALDLPGAWIGDGEDGIEDGGQV